MNLRVTSVWLVVAREHDRNGLRASQRHFSVEQLIQAIGDRAAQPERFWMPCSAFTLVELGEFLPFLPSTELGRAASAPGLADVIREPWCVRHSERSKECST